MTEPAPILFFCDFDETDRNCIDLVCDLAAGLDRNRFAPSAILFGQCDGTSCLEQAGLPVSVVPAPDWLLKIARDSAPGMDMVWRFFAGWTDVRRFESTLSKAILTAGAEAVVTVGTAAHAHAGAAARRASRPALWLAHEWYADSRARLFMSLQARRTATAVACCSGFIAGQYRMHQAPVVIHPGADPAVFDPGQDRGVLRQRLDIPADAPVAGMSANAVPETGLNMFLRAAARIREDVRNARFIISGLNGSRDMVDSLKSGAEQYGLASSLCLPGPEFDEAALLHAMDVFVHPAQKPEPFGRDIVKAMMLGRPVAASASGGPDEIVRNAETGILVDAGDSVRLARAVVQLFDNPEVMRAFGENGRERALAMFSLDRTIQSFESLLERMIP